MSGSTLSIDSLHVRIGTVEVLKDVSLEVAQGSVVAVIGANGAGKTTLMRTIAGQLHPASGRIEYEGAELTRTTSHGLARWGLSLVPEGRHIFPNLTVAENLAMGAVRVKDRDEVVRRVGDVQALFPRLTERMSQLGSSLSGGEQQMLAIGRGLMSRPRLLLLDEPSLGLAPNIVRQIFQAIAQLSRSGLTILVVEQNARLALRLADYAYVLRLGRVVRHGEGRQLLVDKEVARAYLGSIAAQRTGQPSGSAAPIQP